MEEEDFWISPKNPICMRKRRCLDFSLTLQEPKEPNLHAIINLVVIICVQRESGSKGKKKERKVVHMSLCSFFMPSQKWIESIRSDTHAHTVNMSQLHTSMSPNCTQVYYKSITTAHYHKCPSLYKLHCESLCLQWEQFYFLPDCVSILILQFAILKSGFQFWDTAKQNYHDSCKSWRELIFFPEETFWMKLVFSQNQSGAVSWADLSLLFCKIERQLVAEFSTPTGFNLELWLTHSLLVQVSEFFPFFIFQNKLVVEFWFLSTKELRISLCALGTFLVSLERCFSFFKSYIEFEHKWSKKVHKIEGIF